MKKFKKREFPVENVRKYLEPGPVVLVSSAWKGQQNIMTAGWHMVMGFSPSLLGIYIWSENHSFEMIRKSKECVINLPTADLAKTVVGIGNCSGKDGDKFAHFSLTAGKAHKVKAPVIEECFANFECKLVDASQVKKYSLFILKVVHASVATSPKRPTTIHYRGEGEFMLSGNSVNLWRQFRPGNL